MRGAAKARRVYEDAAGYLCRNLDDLRTRIGTTAWGEAFPVVRDGDPDTEEWRQALRDLHDAAEVAGIPGGLGLHSLMGPLPGFPGPTPRSVGWVCPTRRCALVELRDDPNQATPLCKLSDLPMRLVDG